MDSTRTDATFSVHVTDVTLDKYFVFSLLKLTGFIFLNSIAILGTNLVKGFIFH